MRGARAGRRAPGRRPTGVRADATGILLVLAGVSACAVYTVASSRYLGREPTHGVVVVQQLSALAFALVLFAGAGVAGGLEPLDGVSATWASAVSSGTLYYGVAFWFYLNGLRRCSPAVAGLFINLVPVFGVTAAAVLLDERLSSRQWFGVAITLAAVTLLAFVRSEWRRPIDA